MKVRNYINRKYGSGRVRKDAQCRRCGQPFSEHGIYFDGNPRPDDVLADFGFKVNGVYCPKPARPRPPITPMSGDER